MPSIYDWDDKPSILTVAETAEIIRIGRSQMYELVRTPGFPAIRIGRAIRIPRIALEHWVNTQWNRADSTK